MSCLSFAESFFMRNMVFPLCIVLISGCYPIGKSSGNDTPERISRIRFIAEYTLPAGMDFEGTVVGGLSGIDYDVKKDIYYIVSDDPSSRGSARYYTAKIDVSEKRIDSIRIIGVTALLNAGGQAFPDISKDRVHSADVEAMRYDPGKDELIWSMEGQRIIRDGRQELQNPAIVIMERNGTFKDSFALPANMNIQAIEKGPRHNGVFEGLSFDPAFKYLYVSIEEPIYEDGHRAGESDSTAWIRILKFDRQSKQAVAQYAYRVDAVPYPANPRGAFKLNGVSDILCLGNNKLLVIERGYSTGRLPSDVRIYLADVKDADDISAVSLTNAGSIKPVSKRLLLDMNNLGRFIDNIEGVTFGPRLSNGHRSLVFVSDDNFAKQQKTQFLLFEVLP